MANPFDLTGKIALITGASRGIGAAIAHALADQGAYVIVTSRKADACTEVVEQIRSNGGNGEAAACHIGDLHAMEMTVQNCSNTMAGLIFWSTTQQPTLLGPSIRHSGCV